jgi:hypothetical protein
MNSFLAALMDSLMLTPDPACSFQTNAKEGASWSLKMLRFRRY